MKSFKDFQKFTFTFTLLVHFTQKSFPYVKAVWINQHPKAHCVKNHSAVLGTLLDCNDKQRCVVSVTPYVGGVKYKTFQNGGAAGPIHTLQTIKMPLPVLISLKQP